MVEATLVFALGIAIGLLGILVQPLYDVGAIIIFVGVLGILTRLGGWLLWLHHHTAANRPQQ